MKLKPKIFITTLIMMFIVPCITYGYNFGDYVQKDRIINGEVITKSGGIPLKQRFYDRNDSNKLKAVSLYDTQLPSSQIEINMPDGRKRKGYFSQYFYWPVDNNGDPQNLDPLRDPANFNAMFSIPKNRSNNSGGASYLNWQKYHTNYPPDVNIGLNWNFKDGVGSDPISGTLTTNPDANALFLQHPSGLLGNPRFVYPAPDPSSGYVSPIGFAPDLEFYGSIFTLSGYPNLIKHPSLYKNGLAPFTQGSVNFDYMDDTGKWFREPDEQLIKTYNVFAGTWPSMGAVMKDLAKRNYGSDSLINQVKSFLDYQECYSHADETQPGKVMGKYDWDPFGSHFYTYYGLTSPRLMENRDLVFGTKDAPVVDPEGHKHQMELWDRDTNQNGIYGDNGEPAKNLKPGQDILIPGHRYSLHSFLKLEGKEDDKTVNKPIAVNVRFGFNGRKGSMEVVTADKYDPSGNKVGNLEMVTGVDPNDYNKEMIDNLTVGDVVDYRLIDTIVIPKTCTNPTTGQQEPVTKVAIQTWTPYQKQSYHNDNLDLDDNAQAPDMCELEFDVQPPVNDVKIDSFKLYERNQDGTYTEKSDGATLDRDKKYYATVIVKNLNDSGPTKQAVPIGIADGLIGQSFTEARDDVIGDIFQSTNDGSKLIPANIAGTTNPIPMYDPADPKKNTVGYLVEFKVDKDQTQGTYKLTAYIPKKDSTHIYDINESNPSDPNNANAINLYRNTDDVKTITVNVGQEVKENLSIVSLDLYDASGTKFDKLNADGTYSFTPNKTYYIVAQMKHTGAKQLGESTDSVNPYIDFTLWDQVRPSGDTVKIRAQLQGYYKAAASESTPIVEILTYKSPVFPAMGNEVTIEAAVPMNDPALDPNTRWEDLSSSQRNSLTNYKPWNELIFSDDSMKKTYSYGIDFIVSNFQLNPLEVNIQQPCGNSQTVPISFSATVSMVNKDPTALIDRVTLLIKDRFGTVVYRNDNVAFSSGSNSYTLSDSFNIVPNYTLRVDGSTNQATYSGNNPFIIEINPSPYKYKEINYANNTDTKSILLEGHCNVPNPVIPCTKPNTLNNWSTTFYWTERQGTYHSKVCTGTSCSKSGCTTYTYVVEWCSPDNRPYIPPQTVQFQETFKIKGIMFKSQDTVSRYGDIWINILGNSDKNTVRAGQWYSYWIETEYSTNRKTGMPLPLPYYSDMCNFRTRNPGYSQITGPEYIDVRINGYGINEVYPRLYPASTSVNTSTGSVNEKFYLPSKVSKFGETTTPNRYYIPVDGKDGSFTISVSSKPMEGYSMDPTHPYGKQLCENVSAKVLIIGPTNIGSQIIEER